MELVIIWSIVAVLSFVLEFMIPTLITIWFGISAIICVLLAYLGITLNFQIYVFVILSIIQLIFTRKLILRITNKEIAFENKIKIIKKISENEYEAKYKGVVYTVISNQKLEIGETVKFSKFEGNKIIL